MAAAEVASTNLNYGGIDWNFLPAADNWEGIDSDRGIFRKPSRANHTYWYSDEKVPEEKMEGFMEKLQAAWREGQPWTRDKERENVKCAKDGVRVRAWKGKVGRMESWDDAHDYEGHVVIFGVGKLGLVIGDCFSHPFIQCSDFGYANSDGSHEAMIPDTDSAAELFAWVLDEFRSYCDDQYH